MSRLTPFLDSYEWASPEDRALAESDALLFGNVFLRRDENGLMHRIDPTTVTVHEGVTEL